MIQGVCEVSGVLHRGSDMICCENAVSCFNSNIFAAGLEVFDVA